MAVHVFGPWPGDDDSEEGALLLGTGGGGGVECCLLDALPSCEGDSQHYDDFNKRKHSAGNVPDHQGFEWLKKHLFFKKLLQTVKKTRAHEGSIATRSTIASSTCSADCSTSESIAGDNPPLIQQRLLKSGIELETPRDFDFVIDRVSKEVIALQTTHEGENKDDECNQENVSHVKTGIWQVTCLDDKTGLPLAPFYLVTGVSMERCVDTKKLRKTIFVGQSYKRKPKLVLAPTKIAEQLSGYQSGTMAPICHSVDMKLFLEESVAAKANVPGHKLNVGSGMFGKCLSISADKFLEVAKANPKGFQVCSLIRSSKQKSKV